MTDSQKPSLSAAMDTTIVNLKAAVRSAAEAEREYRKFRALKYAEVSDKKEMQAAAKTAWVDAETADKRFDRDLADGMRSALTEEVRNIRQQMSYMQTMANATKEDQAFHRTGQNDAT